MIPADLFYSARGCVNADPTFLDSQQLTDIGRKPAAMGIQEDLSHLSQTMKGT